MKLIFFSLFFCLFALFSNKNFSQDSIQHTINYEIITDYDLLLQKQENGTLKNIIYKDLSYHFEIKIPGWLIMMEVNKPTLWYGMFMDENNVLNIIGVKIFPKELESLDVFIKDVFAKIKLAESTTKENPFYIIKVEDKGKYKELGQSYKVISSLQGVEYHNNYVFVESKSAYIWLELTSSSLSYDISILKFHEFLDGIKIIK